MRLLVVGMVGLFLAVFVSPPALATAALPAGVTVSVGYFDNEHGPNTPPRDWSVTGASSASINFVGGPMSPPGPSGGTWDSGGIRFDNSTAAPVTLDRVVVTIGAKQYNGANELWAPARLTIPANGSMILASPTATRGLFDTSDYHCGGNPPTGVRDGIIPQIVVTQAGTSTNYVDTSQVLTYDCTKPETHDWLLISTGGAPPPPPTPSITAPADGSFNNTGNVTLTGSAPANSTVTVYDGSTSKGTTPASNSGTWTKALAGVPDGTHSYTATAMANGLTSGSSPAVHVTVNTHAPPAPSITAPADGSFNKTGNVILTGSSPANSTVTVYDGLTSQGTTSANGSGTWMKVLTGVSDGTHSYTASATANSLISGSSPAIHVTVDTHAPVTSITSGPSRSTRQTSANFTFSSSETASTFQCRLAGPGSRPGSFSACSSPARFAHLAVGSYTFTVRATDRAGNTDPNPPSRRFAVQARSTSAQAVTSLSLRPAHFLAAGGPSATSAGAKIGSTVTFTLARSGTVRFTIETRLVGRKVHGRCVAASSHNRHGAVCTRYRHVTGSFARFGVMGRNHFQFTGRMDGRTLVPGRYRLVATPITGRGNDIPFRVMR